MALEMNLTLTAVYSYIFPSILILFTLKITLLPLQRKASSQLPFRRSNNTKLLLVLGVLGLLSPLLAIPPDQEWDGRQHRARHRQNRETQPVADLVVQWRSDQRQESTHQASGDEDSCDR